MHPTEWLYRNIYPRALEQIIDDLTSQITDWTNYLKEHPLDECDILDRENLQKMIDERDIALKVYDSFNVVSYQFK